MNKEYDGIRLPKTSLLLTVRMDNFVSFRFIINEKIPLTVPRIFIASYKAHQAHFQSIDNNLHIDSYL